MLTGNGGSLVNHVTTNVLCGSSSLFITICVSLLYIVYNGIFIPILLCYKKQYIMYHSAWETNQTD